MTVWAGLAARTKEFQRDSGMNQDLKQTLWAASVKRTDMAVVSDGFLNDVRNMKERTLAVELLERVPEGEVTSRFKPRWCGVPNSQEATDTVSRQAESLSADWFIVQALHGPTCSSR
jgi:hypothetical protein